MAIRVKKLFPALKHGAYSATGLLPGEDRAAFEKLHRDLQAELRPDGPFEECSCRYREVDVAQESSRYLAQS